MKGENWKVTKKFWKREGPELYCNANRHIRLKRKGGWGSWPRPHRMRLLGLAWAGKNKEAIHKAIREVLAAQRADGGWSDLASMDSTAYATGKALVALQTAGLPASDTAYQRGVQFLLTTQQEDGSWYVKTRAAGFQPYFDNGFPFGVDQWISASGTSWATTALTLAAKLLSRQPRAVKDYRAISHEKFKNGPNSVHVVGNLRGGLGVDVIRHQLQCLAQYFLGKGSRYQPFRFDTKENT